MTLRGFPAADYVKARLHTIAVTGTAETSRVDTDYCHNGAVLLNLDTRYWSLVSWDHRIESF